MRSRRRRGHSMRPWAAALIFLLILAVLCGYLALRCRPVLTAFAESKASWMATRAANDTVSAVLTEHSDMCAKLIHVSYDVEQTLAAVQTDIASVNVLKADVTAAIMQQFEDTVTIDVGIPLGTLIGFDWLSGWGPLIRFPMSVTWSVLPTVTSVLNAQGINQSTYQVSMNVQIGMYIVTPGGRSSVAVNSSFPVAEAVLLGDVPDSLTEVYGDDQTLLGKIFDYGADAAN